MFAATSTTIDSATTLLALSKSIWNLGLSLSKLSQHVASIDTIISDLATEAKALSVACDFIYTRLKELVDNSLSLSINDSGVKKDMWECIKSQIEIISDTTVELERFVKSDGRLDSQSSNRLQHLNRPSPQRDFVVALRIKLSRHTDDLTMSLLLINFLVIGAARHRDPQQTSDESERLRDMVMKLEIAVKGEPQSRLSQIEAKLIGCARDTIARTFSTTKDVPTTAAQEESPTKCRNPSKHGDWLEALEILQLDRRNQGRPATAMSTSPRVSMLGKHSMMTSPRTSVIPRLDTTNTSDIDLEDDFDADLARAALDTGIEAFNTQAWEEADSLLQEALRAILQLSQEQRFSVDFFSLHYRLAVCGYHLHQPENAEQGLLSLVQSKPTTDEQRQRIYHAMHLLSQLYVRMNQIDRARAECEKALQGRRRVLGKQSAEAMESIALTAHIYVLAGNRARAKSCLAMIPEDQRDAVLETVEASLAGLVEHLDFALLLTQTTADGISSTTSYDRRRLSSVSDDSHATTRAATGRLLVSPLGMYRQDSSREPDVSIDPSPTPTQSPVSTLATSPHLPQSNLVQQAMSEDDPPVWGTHTSTPSANMIKRTSSINTQTGLHAAAPKERLYRSDILQRIGCQPRDKIEEAVCASDHTTLVTLLKKRKSFWRSSMRKRGRSERVTALHFAALFGEVEMAQLLIEANFDVNEIPFGYSSSLTPLHFAIGARQVAMANLLLSHGATPCEGECWTSMAKQLLSRAWLTKTSAETDRQDVATHIIAIFTLLLRQGWVINEASGPADDTILHQAVAFWSGAYKWDLDLRVEITKFLCERGADPHKKNAEGKTAYDTTVASGQKDLIEMLRTSTIRKELEGSPQIPIELPGDILDRKLGSVTGPAAAKAVAPGGLR